MLLLRVLPIVVTAFALLLSVNVGAWTASDAVLSFPIIHSDAETASVRHGRIFPVENANITHFFSKIYDTEVAVLNRNLATVSQALNRERQSNVVFASATTSTETSAKAFTDLWPQDPAVAVAEGGVLNKIYSAFVKESKHVNKAAISMIMPGAGFKSTSVPANTTYKGCVQ